MILHVLAFTPRLLLSRPSQASFHPQLPPPSHNLHENLFVNFAITKIHTLALRSWTLAHPPQPQVFIHLQCNATTEKINPRLKNRITIGSTFNPGLSSVYNRNIVPELPPAPAALVLAGRAFLTDSLWSAAARRRMAERGPPGGEEARRMEEDLPVVAVLGESGGDGGEGASA